MQKIVSYKAPKMQPLPGEITNERVAHATLPLKIESARRAIAACESLPELLRYREQAEGLAAAVRVMKHVAPEMVRSANCMVADAWRKGGELLLQYKGVREGRSGKSPRTRAGAMVGLTSEKIDALVRVAKAPAALAYRETQRSGSLQLVARRLPPSRLGRTTYGAGLRKILGSASEAPALTSAASAIRRIPLDMVRALAPDEKKLVRAKVAEIMESLDAIDQAAT